MTEDFLNPYSVKKRLKTGVVPSIFALNKDKVVQKRRSVTEKLEAIRAEEEEETDTASVDIKWGFWHISNLVPRALVTLVQRNVKRETLGQSVSDDKILVILFNCAGVRILTKWRRM